jgi:hypothetical protein
MIKKKTENLNQNSNVNEGNPEYIPRINQETIFPQDHISREKVVVENNEFPEGPVFIPGVNSKTPMINKESYTKPYIYTRTYFFRDIINSLVITWSVVFIVASYLLAYDKKGKELYGFTDPNTEHAMAELEALDKNTLQTVFGKGPLKTEYLGWFEAAHRNDGKFYNGYDIFIEIMCIGSIFGLYWICVGVYDVVKYNYNASARSSFVFLFEEV